MPIRWFPNRENFSLSSYLDAGGKLIITGEDALYNIEDTPFVTTKLGVSVGEEAGGYSQANGLNGTLFEGQSYTFSTASSEYNDRLEPNTGVVTASAVMEYTGDSDYSAAYKYLDGTSMAAPHVAGIAAVITAQKNLTSVEAIELIKNTGVPLDSLSGTTSTGKMVNLYNAVATGVSQPDVTLGDAVEASASSYTIGFNAGAFGKLAPQNTITIEFPAGTKLPAAITSDKITVNTVPVGTSSNTIVPDGQKLTIPTPVAVNHEGSVSIVIDSTANIQNPAAGEQQLSVSTSADPLPVQSSVFTIENAPTPIISSSASTFSEAGANNGSITTTVTATLINDTFTGTNGDDFIADLKVTAANVPDGLTAAVTKASDTTATITLSGNAAAHTNADDINNLEIIFLDGAFTGGDASAVGNAAKNDFAVEFKDPGSISYSAVTFSEASANDGSIATTVTATLTNDTFTGDVGEDYITALKATVTNVPDGLTAAVTKENNTMAIITLSGNATAHMNADDINNLEIVFLDSAFASGNASLTLNASRNDLAIDFFNGLTYSGTTFIEAAANDGSIATPITITLEGDTFTGVNQEDFIAADKAAVNNVPAGLTAEMIKTSDTTVTLSLIGSANNHANINDINNLQVVFADAAFTDGNASAVFNAAMDDISVDFRDPGLLSYSATVFNEAGSDNGSIATEVTVTLSNDTFTGPNGENYITGNKVTVNNVPEGLTAAVIKSSDSSVAIYFTGNAAAHANSNDINNLEIIFANEAFTGANAANITDSGKSDLQINFNDPPVQPPVFIAFTPAAPAGPVTTTVEGGINIDLSNGMVIETENGKETAKFTISEESFTKALNAAKGITVPTITLELKSSSNVNKLEMAGKSFLIQLLKRSNSVIEIKTDRSSYRLPSNLLDIHEIAKDLGGTVDDVKINVVMEKITGELAEQMEQKAEEAGVKLVGDAIDFRITAEANGQTRQMNDFGKTFVTRTIVISETVDSAKTSVVLYNPETGEMSFVPATFKEVDGQTLVTIKRNGNSIYTVMQSNKTFDDIQGHWAQAQIELLATKGLIKGFSETEFRPDDKITRAQFAAILTQSIGLAENRNSFNFSDVRPEAWYAGYVAAAVKAGLVNGFGNGKFRPDSLITREQMSAMIANTIEFVGKTKDISSEQDQLLSRFSDRDQIGNWAKKSVAQAVDLGIINGMTADSFVPIDHATRAQASMMIQRMLSYLQFI